MYDPYKNIDWTNVNKIVSLSHCHCIDNAQWRFDNIVSGDIEHFAISNYYPSAPTYPLSEYFTDIPQDGIGCPNAEHHNWADYPALHVNGLGSFFESGNGRTWDSETQSWVYEYPIGMNHESWVTGFPKILAELQYEDGGGITINHPIWSSLTSQTVMQMLDSDDRILGIEIYNHSCELLNNTGWALDMWDEILLTGRKCYGFCVPDHTAEQGYNPYYGRNILLCSPTEHDCLVAYRNGRFYSRMDNTPLDFKSIVCANGTLTVETVNADTIKIICDGETTSYSGNLASFNIPTNAVYVRVQAKSETDKVFSNPIIFKPYSNKEKHNIGTEMALLWS